MRVGWETPGRTAHLTSPKSPNMSGARPRSRSEQIRYLQMAAGNRAIADILAGGTRAPRPIQREPDIKGRGASTQQRELPRQSIVFLLGEDRKTRSGRPVPGHEFYTAAEEFYRSKYPRARVVQLTGSSRSLVGVFAWLRARPRLRISTMYLVTHAATEGLVLPFEPGDKTRGTSFSELREALASRRRLFELGGQIDSRTRIYIRGCKIGSNRAFVELLNQAFGGESSLEAPTHRMHFERAAGGREARAYYVDYTVERPGIWRASPRELRTAFISKYPQLVPQWRRLRPQRNVRRLRIPGRIARPVTRAKREQAVAGARRLLGDSARYRWHLDTGKKGAEYVAVVAVASRTEYRIRGEIRGATSGRQYVTVVRGEPRRLPPRAKAGHR